MSLTFYEFNKRICLGHDADDSKWRNDVGYRPSDKDGGFKRWLELTGNSMTDWLDEFRRVVYGESGEAEEEIKECEQYDLFSN